MLKRFAMLIGFLFALPLRARHTALARVVGREQALSTISEHAAKRPGLIGVYTRQALYRQLLSRAGVDIHFGYQTLLSKPNAKIGDRVYLGRFCTVGWVTIADDARIADGAQLLSGAHHHGTSHEGVKLQQTSHQPIRIGKGAWIGANAVVMADVGDGAIVGAGAVVTKPVAPGQTVVGVPAKPITQAQQSRQAA